MDSTRQLAARIRMSADAGYCLVRSTSEQQQMLERVLYRRYPHDEWGTFFRFGYRQTRWGLLTCLVDLLPPGRGDFDDRSPLVEFRSGYINRALEAFEGCKFGVGFIHSHPQACQPSPSRADDDMDSYFASEFEKFSEGRPYLSLIASRDASGRRSFSGRAFHKGRWLPVTDWLLCGQASLRREKGFRIKSEEPYDSGSHERVRQLLGEKADARLRNSIVAIVGCSGLGTPAAHVLARGGVGEFVLVDDGVFKDSNHERNHASRAADLGRSDLSKVDLLKRLIHEISPQTRVTTARADVLDAQAVDELVRCDLILGCTDSYYARAALGDLATHYSLPILDLAVQMGANEGILTEQVGEIARYMPGLPCPWCRNRVTAADVRAETSTDEDRTQAERAAAAAIARGDDGAQYWNGLHHQELTVGYMTTAVAAIGAGYAHNWLTGAARMPHNRLQFDLGLQSLGVVADDRDSLSGCTCRRCIGHADQGSADFTVSQRNQAFAPTSAIRGG